MITQSSPQGLYIPREKIFLVSKKFRSLMYDDLGQKCFVSLNAYSQMTNELKMSRATPLYDRRLTVAEFKNLRIYDRFEVAGARILLPNVSSIGEYFNVYQLLNVKMDFTKEERRMVSRIFKDNFHIMYTTEKLNDEQVALHKDYVRQILHKLDVLWEYTEFKRGIFEEKYNAEYRWQVENNAKDFQSLLVPKEQNMEQFKLLKNLKQEGMGGGFFLTNIPETKGESSPGADFDLELPYNPNKIAVGNEKSADLLKMKNMAGYRRAGKGVLTSRILQISEQTGVPKQNIWFLDTTPDSPDYRELRNSKFNAIIVADPKKYRSNAIIAVDPSGLARSLADIARKFELY